jgi:uncharacterized membrane protein
LDESAWRPTLPRKSRATKERRRIKMANKSINRNTAILASAAAGLVAVAVVMATPGNARAEEVKCYGINKCKGTGECGGKDHSCAGKNACAGHGWLKIDKDKCLKIKGGRLTPAEGD